MQPLGKLVHNVLSQDQHPYNSIKYVDTATQINIINQPGALLITLHTDQTDIQKENTVKNRLKLKLVRVDNGG